MRLSERPRQTGKIAVVTRCRPSISCSRAIFRRALPHRLPLDVVGLGQRLATLRCQARPSALHRASTESHWIHGGAGRMARQCSMLRIASLTNVGRAGWLRRGNRGTFSTAGRALTRSKSRTATLNPIISSDRNSVSTTVLMMSMKKPHRQWARSEMPAAAEARADPRAPAHVGNGGCGRTHREAAECRRPSPHSHSLARARETSRYGGPERHQRRPASPRMINRGPAALNNVPKIERHHGPCQKQRQAGRPNQV